MKRLLVTVTALALLSAAPAGADIVEKAENTAINAAVGVVECPKAWWDEASRGGVRSFVGALVTGPVMCGANLAVRYIGVAADIVTLPWGDNLVKPNALDKASPLRLP